MKKLICLIVTLCLLFPFVASSADDFIRSYSSDTLKITIERTRENTCRVYVARIWVKDPERQIKKATGIWHKELFLPNEMPGTEDAILVINGSGFIGPQFHLPHKAYGDVRDNYYTSLGGLVKTNGEVFRDIPLAFTGLSIEKDGLQMYENANHSEVLGANTWSFLDVCCIIKDGKINLVKPQSPHEGSVRFTPAARNIIAKIDAHNYIIFEVRKNAEGRGLSLSEAAKFIIKYNPEWAFNLDGGRSASMVLQDEIITGNLRKVFDVMYFCD